MNQYALIKASKWRKINHVGFRLVVAFSLCWFAGCAHVSQQAAEDKAVKPQAPVVKTNIAAVGDMMLGGKAQALLQREGYSYPFVKTQHLLQKADIAIGNLETALTDRGEPVVPKQYLFRNPADKVAPALQVAGFDIVSLANNHSLDYGKQGLDDTIAALNLNNIKYHGAGENLAAAREPAVIELENGQKVAFLAYSNTFPEEFWATDENAGTAFGHEQHVREDVAALVKQCVDIIVVSFHWGQERNPQLRSYQPLLAHAAIDAGADLVIGHHPHILQAVELYRRGLILYSLGNYTFTTFSNAVQYSAVANIKFENGRFKRLEMTPININNFQVQAQPQLLSEEEAKKVYQQLDELSQVQGAKLSFEKGIIVLVDK